MRFATEENDRSSSDEEVVALCIRYLMYKTVNAPPIEVFSLFPPFFTIAFAVCVLF